MTTDTLQAFRSERTIIERALRYLMAESKPSKNQYRAKLRVKARLIELRGILDPDTPIG